MIVNALTQVGIYLIVLLVLVRPLGCYMARVYQGQPCGLDRLLGWLERVIYWAAGVDPQREMSWKSYAGALLLFNLLGFLAVYGLLRLQAWLPLNPQELGMRPRSGL
jgi:K+-transporting ATPase ATPase A chain